MVYFAQKASRLLVKTSFRKLWILLSRPVFRQVLPRIYKKTTTNFYDNVRINIDFEDQIQSQIYWYGFHQGDFLSFQTLMSLIAEDSVVFDIGANVGAFTLPFAKKAKRGFVYSFEPMKEAFSRLRENVELNGFENVKLSKIAVSNSVGEISIHTPSVAWKGLIKNKGMTTAYPSENLLKITNSYIKESVSTISLDDFVEKNNIKKVDVVKVDVEGSEMNVLKGMAKILKNYHPIILLEVNIELLSRAGVKSLEIVRFLQNFDYEIHAITGSSVMNLGEGSDVERNCNILCRHAA